VAKSARADQLGVHSPEDNIEVLSMSKLVISLLLAGIAIGCEPRSRIDVEATLPPPEQVDSFNPHGNPEVVFHLDGEMHPGPDIINPMQLMTAFIDIPGVEEVQVEYGQENVRCLIDESLFNEDAAIASLKVKKLQPVVVKRISKM
jgi:hypothetical protein